MGILRSVSPWRHKFNNNIQARLHFKPSWNQLRGCSTPSEHKIKESCIKVSRKVNWICLPEPLSFPGTMWYAWEKTLNSQEGMKNVGSESNILALGSGGGMPKGLVSELPVLEGWREWQYTLDARWWLLRTKMNITRDYNTADRHKGEREIIGLY